MAIDCKSFCEMSSLKSSTRPFITEAALDEPPPKPLPAGMFFIRSIEIPPIS